MREMMPQLLRRKPRTLAWLASWKCQLTSASQTADDTRLNERRSSISESGNFERDRQYHSDAVHSMGARRVCQSVTDWNA